VGDANGLAAERLQVRRGGEGQRADLPESGRDRSGTDPATKLLTRAERPGLADGREHRTHLVVTLDPGDLLDEVLLPGDVDAEAGHLGLELLSAAGDLHGRLLKRVADVAGRDVPAQDEARARRPDAHPPARRRAASFDRAGEDGTAR